MVKRAERTMKERKVIYNCSPTLLCLNFMLTHEDMCRQIKSTDFYQTSFLISLCTVGI